MSTTRKLPTRLQLEIPTPELTWPELVHLDVERGAVDITDHDSSSITNIKGATLQWPESPKSMAASSYATTVSENEKEKQEPVIVDFDGPDDLENPKNWPEMKKWVNIVVLSFLTIIS